MTNPKRYGNCYPGPRLRMPQLAIIGICVFCSPLILERNALAQAPDQQSGSDTEAKVAATVNGVPVLIADVELQVRQALGDRTATEQARILLQAEALERLVDQQKILVQLKMRDEACTEKELDVEMGRLQDEMARQEKTLDDYCQSLQIPRTSLRRMLQWQLSWKRCCGKHLTDENLQQYFERHHKEFDGTTLRVAQILLKPRTDANREALLERARAIRREIVEGKLDFAEAARKYSESPSGRDGGTLDWISRHAPMPEFFSRAAYQLDVGEVSQPVESPYGVHLIHCLEIKPGQKRWREVRQPLSDAMAKYLFHWLATRPEPAHDVRYCKGVPHFKPGTRELAEE